MSNQKDLNVYGFEEVEKSETIKVVLVGEKCVEKPKIILAFGKQKTYLTEEEEKEEEEERKKKEKEKEEKEAKKRDNNNENNNENIKENNDKKDNENKIETCSGTFTKKTLFFKENQKSLKLEIWDSAGQKEYSKIMTRVLCKNANSIIFVYDITRKSSFEEIKNYWVKNIKENCLSDAIFAIVGNKSHLYEIEEVDKEEARKYAESINAIFRLVSTRELDTVNNLFYEIGKRYFKIVDVGQNKVDDEEKQNNSKIINIKDKKSRKKKPCLK